MNNIHTHTLWIAVFVKTLHVYQITSFSANSELLRKSPDTNFTNRTIKVDFNMDLIVSV